ncbi:hypothetical protein JST97_22660 [bacterium]|nr:hypothetical protein [bacterium]
MDIRNQYAFTQNNFVGQTASKGMTNLVVASAANGEPVVKPCKPDSFIPVSDHVALAHRPNAESDWQPVRSLAQFQEIVKNTPAEQLGQNLGVWTDKRSFFIFGKRDGLPQNREVQSFADRWSNMQTTLTRPLVDKGFRLGNTPESDVIECQVGLEAAQVSIDPGAFEVKPGTYPGKEVGFFHEVGKVSQHDIYLPKGLNQPAEVISNGGEKSLLDPNHPELFNSHNQPVYVMPKVLTPGQADSASGFHTFS